MKPELVAFLLVCGTMAAAAPDWDWERLPSRAEDFVESIAVNGGPFEKRRLADGRWEGNLYEPRELFELGVRYYRAGVMHDIVPQNQPELAEQAWLKYGARPILLVDAVKARTVRTEWLGVKADGDFSALCATLRRYAPGLIAGVEGPNEVNNKFGQDLNLRYKGRTDEEAATVYQRDLYSAVKADPELRHIPVIMYTSIFSDYMLGGKTDAFDYMNMHSYQADWEVEASLYFNMSRAWNLLPRGATIKPFLPTECGFDVRPDPKTGRGLPSQLRTQAIGVPMIFAEYFRYGIPRTCLFAVQNTDAYGLLEGDWKTRRPSWWALQSFIRILSDAKWDAKRRQWIGGRDFEPRVLRFKMPDAPETVHTLTLQKADGRWCLLIWNDIRNRIGDRDLENADVPVELAFKDGTSVTCTAMWRQTDFKGSERPGAFRKVSHADVVDGKLKIAVPSSVVIVELTPAKAARAAGPKPPTPRVCQTAGTDRSVSIRIEMPASASFEAVTVSRAGMQCESIHRWKFKAEGDRLVYDYVDATHWIHPGLGYPFFFRAVSTEGRLGDEASCVASTRDERYNLAIGRFGVHGADVKGRIKPGDKVRFEAEVVNDGEGASPNPTDGVVGMYSSAVSVVFWVGEEGAFFGGSDGRTPIRPWDCKTYVTHDGKDRGYWTAKSGTHLVRLFLDDVGRVTGEKTKFDNFAQRTITIGDYPGVLSAVERTVTGGVDAPTELATDGRLVLPADRTKRRATVYLDVNEGATAELKASLSDQSAPPFSMRIRANLAGDTTPVPGHVKVRVDLEYQAATHEAQVVLKAEIVENPNRRPARVEMRKVK